MRRRPDCRWRVRFPKGGRKTGRRAARLPVPDPNDPPQKGDWHDEGGSRRVGRGCRGCGRGAASGGEPSGPRGRGRGARGSGRSERGHPQECAGQGSATVPLGGDPQGPDRSLHPGEYVRRGPVILLDADQSVRRHDAPRRPGAYCCLQAAGGALVPRGQTPAAPVTTGAGPWWRPQGGRPFGRRGAEPPQRSEAGSPPALATPSSRWPWCCRWRSFSPWSSAAGRPS